MKSPLLRSPLPAVFVALGLLLVSALPALAADYTITTTSNSYTVTNSTNHADTLGISQPVAGTIAFAASGRTFSVNGGANTNGMTANLPLSGVASLIVNCGSGGETISFGAFSGTSFPTLTIFGGVGNDAVNFNGSITLATNNSLNLNLQSSATPGADTITVASGVQLLVSGTGTANLDCSRNVSLAADAIVRAQDGNLTVKGNQQATVTTGNFTGVSLTGSGTLLEATGQGTVTVKGTGGNDAGGYQIGVDIEGGAQIVAAGGSNSVSVTGVGGASTGPVNRGVTVYGSGSAILANDFGSVTVVGTAGKLGNGYGIGISVLSGGQIGGSQPSDGSASSSTLVTGTGGGASGSSNQGVEIGGTGSGIVSGFFLTLTGTPGPNTSVGLSMATSAALGSGGTTELSIAADSVTLDNTCTVTAVGGTAEEGIEFSTLSATHINLGAGNSTGTFGLTAAELARLNSPLLQFQTGSTGDITISAAVNRSSKTDLYLNAGSGGVLASANGTDLSLAGGTLYLGGTLKMPFNGASADSGFPQLNVAGNVNLGGSGLDLTGSIYPGSVNQTFTIVANDGANATAGTFANLPEGAYLPWPGNASLAAKISYMGGDGNDVVLTLVPVAQALNVTTTANDTSVGSLQAAINFAAAHSGADTVTFATALNGATITLSGPANGAAITIADLAGVTIDASSLTNGLTIQGAGPSGNFGLFQVNPGASLTLRNLTLANGGGSAFASANYNGGAIFNGGTTVLIGCTLRGNSAFAGGALSNGGAATQLTLLQCTLTGNSGLFYGGAIYSSGLPLTVSQCTITANSGGGIEQQYGTMSLANSIVAGNTGAADLDNGGSSPAFTALGANIVQSIGGTVSFTGSGTIINAAPVLAPLGSYGGSTQTMPPLPGSPAIDPGNNNLYIPLDPKTNMPFTTDQRGFTRISNGMVDLGAVETSALQVTTTADNNNPGTLRYAEAAALDVTTTITFAPSLAGSTISLTGATTPLTSSRNIAIDANGLVGGITLAAAGAGNFRFLSVPAGQTVFLRNLTLANGGGSSLTSQGGALTNAGTLTASGCVFSANSIANNGGNGGAIYNASGGSMTFNGCVFAGNHLNGGAGGAISNDGSMVVNASTFNGNTALSGGALLNNGTLTLNQCTLASNSATGGAGQGGAIYSGNGSCALTQCTFSLNSSTNGGGVYKAGGTATLANSIVSGNTAGTGADMTNANAGSTFVLSGANIILGFGGSFNNSGTLYGIVPLLAPLGNYGGPTQTMALLPGSYARDNAKGSTATTDQRGLAIIDGKPDIGAYEAGDITNYNAWIYENLPASTGNNAAVHAATYDYDGDGVSNYNEWLAQTSPADSTIYLHITSILRNGTGTVSLTYPTVLGRYYGVDASVDLVNWTNIAGGVLGTGSSYVRSVPSNNTGEFFRVTVTPP